MPEPGQEEEGVDQAQDGGAEEDGRLIQHTDSNQPDRVSQNTCITDMMHGASSRYTGPEPRARASLGTG